MDVMNPEVYWIENRCYRRNPSKTLLPTTSTQKFWSSKDKDPTNSCNSGNSRGIREDKSLSETAPSRTTSSGNGNNGGGRTSNVQKPYVEEDDYSCDPEAPDDSEDDGYVIVSTGNNGFRTKCDDIPSQLFAVVIGAKGSTKMRIERDTGTRITVPKQNSAKGFIEIEGRTAQAVIKARRQIDLLTSQTRFRNDSTHFPCFPLNKPNIIEKVKEFKELVTSFGADPGFFIDAEKVHLTICVVTLFNEDERKRAAEILENAQKEITEKLGHKGKIIANLKGLEIMNDDATQADILYAKCSEVGDSNVLQQMADFIAKKLAVSGLAKDNRTHHVKLHCTIMNSLKKAESLAQVNENGENNGGRNNNSRGRMSRPKFDASVILRDFGEYDFGQVEITEIKLATRFTSGPDGFYKSYCSIPF